MVKLFNSSWKRLLICTFPIAPFHFAELFCCLLCLWSWFPGVDKFASYVKGHGGRHWLCPQETHWNSACVGRYGSNMHELVSRLFVRLQKVNLWFCPLWFHWYDRLRSVLACLGCEHSIDKFLVGSGCFHLVEWRPNWYIRFEGGENGFVEVCGVYLPTCRAGGWGVGGTDEFEE